MKSAEDKSTKFVHTLRDLWPKMSEKQRKKVSKRILSIMAKNLGEEFQVKKIKTS